VKLLLLGGPRFLGGAIADAALERGHELTFFNRGTTNPELYPEVERIVGDRKGALDGLSGRQWDAVVDTCGYLPRDVRASAEAVAESGLYCFVSSVSVYADLERPNVEDDALAELGDLPDDQVTDESYGPLKALCEEAAREVFDEHALVVRPGLIAGPYDPTGRFTYWPHRLARGGEVLAPAPPERVTQVIDVRDLAEWIVELCERSVSGTFNATHPGLSWEQLLESCSEVTRSDAAVTWVPDDFLLEHDVGPWMELPLWLPDPRVEDALHADVSRAVATGLRFRPLVDTALGALELAEKTDAAGLTPERENRLLTSWHERQRGAGTDQPSDR
jgi:2'-hydroxyisoflavone reductase